MSIADASRIEGITPDWLTAALRDAGVLHGGRVVGVESTQVGTGQLGDCFRLVPAYEGEHDAAPTSLVAKLPAVDPVSRGYAGRAGLYANEVRFYREVAAHLDVRAPRSYLAEMDDDGTHFVLLLEDLGPARACDQISGCTPEQAALAMEQAARIHAPSWHRNALFDRLGLGRLADGYRMMVPVYPDLHAVFRERYADVLEPEMMELGDRLAERFGRWVDHLEDAPCLIHVDFRLDNMLFDAHDGAVPLAVVDWQSISVGPGVADVSYFIGAGLLVDDRRAHEEQLVHHYHRELVARGVADLSWERCWAGYQVHTVMGFVTAVNASVNVQRTERGDRMFMTMARRHGQQMIDNDTLARLDK